ncbi:hypothetical protein RFI_10731 [Reticulomyxa filosa]|uniref:ADP-ribosylation/Crystallin J1 n=1 Tax=Reticulomyxa filosa TaxID=46433 RepID=X6NKC4_RETFI|nr:hypothetical protein RFI_10731 [Reticulomyxa filosa]|eukprot:ETO26406.1 hypothetical protein RFI_10731 [Reticulomyxa filosa]
MSEISSTEEKQAVEVADMNNLIKDRVRGLLLGLSAGDRNGGPQRLALLLILYMLKHKEKCHESMETLWSDYYQKWYRNGGFDTGVTFIQIDTALQLNKATITSPYEAAKQIYEEQSKGKFPPEGIGNAHRNVVLSMTVNNPGLSLTAMAVQESVLTHYSPKCKQIAVCCNVLCRALIQGKTWMEALQIMYDSVDTKLLTKEIEAMKIREIIKPFLEPKNSLHKKNKVTPTCFKKTGWCVDAFRSALYFVDTYTTFDEALSHSIKFAGPSNYCPVLVGAIAGCKFGYDTVLKSKELKHYYNLTPILEDCLKHFVQGDALFDKEQNLKSITLLNVLDKSGQLVADLWLHTLQTKKQTKS